MSETDETLEQLTEDDNHPLDKRGAVLKAIEKLSNRFDEFEKNTNAQFKAINYQLEVVRQGIAQNSARFDQLEALALEAKSIALVTRSQVTILTEEIRQNTKILV